MPIRTLLVDDEPLARSNLRSLLSKHDSVEVVGECSNGKEALQFLSATPIDLVFLDVQMPEMDGFQVLEALDCPQMPAIIFVTAFDEHAIRAFDVSATDYLLKPVDDERFARALRRAKDALARREFGEIEVRVASLLSQREPERKFPSRLLVKTHSRVFFVPVDDIDYIEAEDYYSALHIGTKTHLLREPIKELESRLDPSLFVRVHRSTIVNVRRIKELRNLPGGGHSVHLIDGTVLRLSRARWERMREFLAGAR